MRLLLIHPPVSKPCEPPAGLARLCGYLRARGAEGVVWDANLGGLLAVLGRPQPAADTWTGRALRGLPTHLRSLRDPALYENPARYRRAVADLNRVLEKSAAPFQVRLGLANYQHDELLPTRSRDLIRSWERPEANPFYPYFQSVIPGLLRTRKFDAVGISVNFLTQALCAFALAGFLRKEVPWIKLVLGGGLITSWMRAPGWSNPFSGLVDHLVAGPGERELGKILGIEEDGESGPWAPDYRSCRPEEYFSPGFILPYSASTGCYWSKCSFCPEKSEGSSHEPLPPQRVVQELRALSREMKPVLIHLLDNAIRPELLQALAQEPPGAPWYGFARISRHLTDPQFCHALRRAGCVMLQLGLESGDQGVLDQLQKGMDLKMAELALHTLHRAGIATYVYLLFGTPPESLKEARHTLEFTVRHQEAITFLNLAVFNLPRHSPEARTHLTAEFNEGDLSLYTNFAHPRGWDRNRVRQFLDKEFKRHPAIAPIIRRDPPIFTSNHAPFFASATRFSDPD